MTIAAIPAQPRVNSSSPGQGSFAITPSDSADLAVYARRLFVTGAGTVKFTGFDGQDDTWTVAALSYLDCGVRKVFATGTTATGIHGIR